MEKLNNNLCQVFLMSCHCGLPISFARHHWFVLNNKGKISRYEVLIEKDHCGESWGYLHKNTKEAFEALGLFSITGKAILQPDVLAHVEGELAERMMQFIENSHATYPHCHNYSITNANSNTYIQWVLNYFPEFPGKLPWNAFGKGLKVKV